MNPPIIYVPYPFDGGYWTVYEDAIVISTHCSAISAEDTALAHAERVADQSGQMVSIKIQSENGAWHIMAECLPATI